MPLVSTTTKTWSKAKWSGTKTTTSNITLINQLTEIIQRQTWIKEFSKTKIGLSNFLSSNNRTKISIHKTNQTGLLNKDRKVQETQWTTQVTGISASVKLTLEVVLKGKDPKELVEWSHRNPKETQRIQIINTDKSEAEGNKDQWVEQVALKTQLEEVNLEDDL